MDGDRCGVVAAARCRDAGVECDGTRYHFPCCILNLFINREVLACVSVVINRDLRGHFGFRVRCGGQIAHCCCNECAVMSHMHRAGLGKPHMSIDPGSLVEPAFLDGGVGAHHQNVGAAVVEVVACIVVKAGVAAVFRAQVETVQPHLGVAINSVELDADAAAEIGLGNREGLAIPPDAVLRKVAADGLGAVITVPSPIEWQLDSPVMRQVDRAPRPVVEFW